jgi:hypothetical protein
METTYRSTSVLIPNRFDSKQKNLHNYNTTPPHRTDAPPEIPPSPTLTNPDMILPDDGERQSSTPSPPFQLSSDTHMLQATGGNAYYHSNGSTAQAVGSYRPPPSRWTYDGHAHGRPLSDIGEEEYQPSPPSFKGRYTSERYNGKSDTDSIGSGSTISAGSQQRRQQQQQQKQQENLHTAESRDQEADLDSKRSSFASQGSIERARAQTSDALASGPLQSPEEEGPSAILSSEAERILENAKRRLTVSRAFSSMPVIRTFI